MRRSKHFQVTENHEGSWAISYGDMITLLLSFFVIFFSFDFNKEVQEKLDQSAIRDLASHQSEFVKNGLVQRSTNASEIEEVTTVIKNPKGQIVVIFKNTSFFRSGQTQIRESVKSLLDQFAQKYLPYSGKYKIKIQAFTDKTPVSPRNRYRDNIELSALRGISVLRYLNKIGIPRRRIEIGGKGILSQNAMKVFGFDKKSNQEKLELSRTIAIVLYREDAV